MECDRSRLPGTLAGRRAQYFPVLNRTAGAVPVELFWTDKSPISIDVPQGAQYNLNTLFVRGNHLDYKTEEFVCWTKKPLVGAVVETVKVTVSVLPTGALGDSIYLSESVPPVGLVR